MHFVPLSADVAPRMPAGWPRRSRCCRSSWRVLCFVIAAGFLLSLVPEPRQQPAAVAATGEPAVSAGLGVAAAFRPEPDLLRSRSPRRG